MMRRLIKRVIITAGPFAYLELFGLGLLAALVGYFLWFVIYIKFVAPYLTIRFGGEW